RPAAAALRRDRSQGLVRRKGGGALGALLLDQRRRHHQRIEERRGRAAALRAARGGDPPAGRVPRRSRRRAEGMRLLRVRRRLPPRPQARTQTTTRRGCNKRSLRSRAWRRLRGGAGAGRITMSDALKPEQVQAAATDALTPEQADAASTSGSVAVVAG